MLHGCTEVPDNKEEAPEAGVKRESRVLRELSVVPPWGGDIIAAACGTGEIFHNQIH